MCVRGGVCLCVCVRARAFMCVRVCVCVCVGRGGHIRCVFHSSFFVCRSDPVLPYRIFLFSCPRSTILLKVDSCWHL